MNNLWIQSVEKIVVNDGGTTMESSSPPPPHLAGSCVASESIRRLDSLEKVRFCLTRNGFVYALSDASNILWKENINVPLTEDENDDTGVEHTDWFSVSLLQNQELVCLSKSGAIVAVSFEGEQRETELVGEFENGILAASWSPDKEILVLATHLTEEQKIVLLSMNSSFEILAEVELCRSGSTNGEATSPIISVAWRPDSSLVAVSFVDPDSSERRIQIYKRHDLSFHAVGRVEDGSGKLVTNIAPTPMAWAGSSCSLLLAAVHRKSKKTTQVVFFESNGLRHRDFVLREPSGVEVIDLAWSADHLLLGVVIASELGSKVQFWHRRNYHWYMKQELRFEEKASSILFDERDGTKVSICFAQECFLREYSFRWDWSDIRTVDKCSSAYVVDGADLQITDLHKAVIPPPMCHVSLSFSDPIANIAFTADNRNSCESIVMLSDNSLSLVLKSSNGFSRTVGEKYRFPEGMKANSLFNFLVVESSEDLIRLIAVGCDYGDTFLIEFQLSLSEKILVCKKDALSKKVLAIVNWVDCPYKGGLIQYRDGCFQEFVVGHFEEPVGVRDSSVTAFLEPCPWFCASKITGGSGDPICIGMSSTKRLFLGDVLLADSISSFNFSVSQKYVSFITSGSRCQLRFISLHDLQHFDALMGAEEASVLCAYEPRAVERGAQLISVVPQYPTVVLQMPRGNLECICPRALVLQFCMKLIIERMYREAFLMMRKQKVDLNLLVDMNPSIFISGNGFQNLIDQIPETEYLNLLISSLNNGSVLENRYAVPKWMSESNLEWFSQSKDFDFSMKVNSMCESFRKALMNMDVSRHGQESTLLLPILTTFAKEEPPRLEDSLLLIKSRADVGSRTPLFDEKSQHAIHYLAFLADYELLFATALSMYDYDLARAVARNSQMDPRVYLPLLQRYRELPEWYAKYEVDLKLGRYDMALTNLVEASRRGDVRKARQLFSVNEKITSDDAFEECCRLITENKLFELGLKLFKSDAGHYRDVSIQLSDALMKENKAKVALAVLMNSEPLDVKRAMAAAKTSYDWRKYFELLLESEYANAVQDENIAMKLSLEAREIAGLISSRAYAETGETKRKQYCDAARILIDYADDVSGAVDLLILATNWREALRLSSFDTNNSSFLRQRVLSASVNFAAEKESEFERRSEDFARNMSRFIEVLRKIKVEGKYLDLNVDVSAQLKDDDSLFSVASGTSLFSVASGASSFSTNSTGSTGSISSVISLKSATSKSFALTGKDIETRHHSKYGVKEKKKKKKKNKGSSRIRPGTEGELKELAGVIVSDFLDEEDRYVMEETLNFLMNTGELPQWKSLYDAYVSCGTSMNRNLGLLANNEESAETDPTTQINLPEHPLEKQLKELKLPGLDAELIHFRSLDV